MAESTLMLGDEGTHTAHYNNIRNIVNRTFAKEAKRKIFSTHAASLHPI